MTVLRVAVCAVLAGLAAAFVATASQSAARYAAGLLVPLAVGVPLSFIVAATWSVARDREHSLADVLPHVARNAAMVLAIWLASAATLSPRLGFFELEPTIELRPFAEVIWASTDRARLEAVAVLVGNAALFVVLGALLGQPRSALSRRRFALMAIGLSIGLEVGQAVLGTGRATDITEASVRFAALTFGFSVWRARPLRVAPAPAPARNLA